MPGNWAGIRYNIQNGRDARVEIPRRALAAEIELAEADGNRRYTHHWRLADPAYRGDFLALDGPGALFCFPGSDMNYVAGLGFDGRPGLGRDLDRIDAFYHTHGSSWTLEVSSLADPEVVEMAAARGYRPGPLAHLWGKQLLRMDLEPLHSAPPVEIIEVGSDHAHRWAQAAAEGFGDGVVDSAMAEILQGFAQVPGTFLYVAVVADGAVAGSAAMALGPGHAKLFSGSTLPPFRGRGIQSALLHHRLNQAHVMGLDWAIVQTDPNTTSERNVTRLGFDLIYSKLSLKSPPAAPQNQGGL